ncbi:hypothetical protein [Dictyobacter arantiisoli]|uniref:Helix-turn-helix domain-containing protein n=1 Tax=Dictyobacter arantiisoli TaxID=2014874 RepID=A0A5A5TLG3_9CHLR|nr:hypothetical protein [Dictyobacter arantiisoli]GCF11943.1 hypothetical protein KDI_55070 [Dictyobacter arantiisoli]
MPRYQPPKGYYTSTQVKAILNISGAMIANYVEKGKIRHVVPPGRKHGFSLKKDVDALTRELDAFFKLEEEYTPGNKVQLYLAEIGIKPSLHKDLRSKYGAKLISNFMDAIVDLGKRGVIVERIVSVGATRSGVRLLQHFGFSEIIFPREDTRVFVIDMKKSGAPITHAYREAYQTFAGQK